MFELADNSDRDDVLARLRALRGQIPDLLALRCGADALATEGCADIVLITEHADPAGLQGYVDHPAHQQFAGWLRPKLSSRRAVDTDDLS